MKRIICALLVFALLVPANIVAAQELAQGSPLADAVARYLESMEYEYGFDDDQMLFSYSVALGYSLEACNVLILILDDGLIVYAYPPIRADFEDSAALAKAAEFIARANYDMILGNFELDFHDGEVRYKTSAICFENVPSKEELERLIDIPPIMVNRYGDALASVLKGTSDPGSAIREAESK
ncbi:MAG: YbjN domain-containing protein [Eubacteriaceae bacterium]|nr:YbjN domain-containing protein [Eubacteriaceae bacterium]